MTSTGQPIGKGSWFDRWENRAVERAHLAHEGALQCEEEALERGQEPDRRSQGLGGATAAPVAFRATFDQKPGALTPLYALGSRRAARRSKIEKCAMKFLLGFNVSFCTAIASILIALSLVGCSPDASTDYAQCELEANKQMPLPADANLFRIDNA
jgi:hypothetical protein